jgi:hypothetical protein
MAAAGQGRPPPMSAARQVTLKLRRRPSCAKPNPSASTSSAPQNHMVAEITGPGSSPVCSITQPRAPRSAPAAAAPAAPDEEPNASSTASAAAAASTAAATSAAAAASAAAAPTASGKLYPGLGSSGVFPVEDIERRQAYVGDFFLVERDFVTRGDGPRRCIRGRHSGRRGCAARQR